MRVNRGVGPFEKNFTNGKIYATDSRNRDGVAGESGCKEA